MEEEVIINQPFITDPKIIAQFAELGIDAQGKTAIELESALDTLEARESAKLVFDPKDPLDYISAGLTFSGLGTGLGLTIKGARTAKKGAKLKAFYDKVTNLRSALNPFYKRGKIPGGFQAAPKDPLIPFGIKVPQALTYTGVGIKASLRASSLITNP